MHRTTSQITILLMLLATFATKKIHAQFDIEDSNSTASLRGIHNVGGGVAWASGTNGTVLRTEDGGYLWQTCTIPPGAEKLDFRGIQAFDENTAIVMSSGKGDLSRLYKTTDGCQTWKLLFTNPDKEGFWDAIQAIQPIQFDGSKSKFVDGVLLGDPVNGNFVIYKTNDKGDRWYPWVPSKQLHPAEAYKGESLFAASNSSAVMPGANGQFAFVTGGGGGARFIFEQHHDPCDCKPSEGFSHISLPIPSSESAGAFSVARRPGKKSWEADFMVAGGDYQKPDAPGTSVFIPYLVPAAALFSRRAITSTTAPHGYRSAVAWDPQQKLWITVGPNGTDISRDDGKNWTPLKPSGYDPPDADKNWNALSLPFVVGPHGRIGRLRTIDQTPAHPK
jgi:hypothetical protein